MNSPPPPPPTHTHTPHPIPFPPCSRPVPPHPSPCPSTHVVPSIRARAPPLRGSSYWAAAPWRHSTGGGCVCTGQRMMSGTRVKSRATRRPAGTAGCGTRMTERCACVHLFVCIGGCVGRCGGACVHLCVCIGGCVGRCMGAWVDRAVGGIRLPSSIPNPSQCCCQRLPSVTCMVYCPAH